MPQSITLAHGDGIGPEIMQAVLSIIKASGAKLHYNTINIGESVYKTGQKTGIDNQAWQQLARTKVLLKAPITTPQGGGFKSLNVAIRKRLGLYANIRPCVSYHPFIPTKHPKMNLVIIRENEEDLYTGIEYQHTNDMIQCLKIITRGGCERISRFAFEYAVKNNRKKATCFTKDNIMKKTDGLFRKVFEQTGAHYPALEKEHWIIDIGAAKMACTPEHFDVIVLPNLYGDILSDVAAQISGSVGMAGSANMGDEYAMFEAVHGSAPKRAGQNMANPSGLLQAGVLMLHHIGQHTIADNIQNAWLKTLEDGIHTYDIYRPGLSQKKAGTKEFAAAVISRLGQTPRQLTPARYQKPHAQTKQWEGSTAKTLQNKTCAGVDIFIDDPKKAILDTAKNIQQIKSSLKLKFISSKGLIVWPGELKNAWLSDHFRLRFLKENNQPASHTDIINLLSALNKHNFDVTKTEHLYLFDGRPGFSTDETN